MVIVLNDNGMSINKNVGGMATLLSKQRVKPGYLHFKRFYRSTVGKAPGLYRSTASHQGACERSCPAEQYV
ncbi:MAG: 1-deoxy-D-xylulose-5-phosphate synthase N-terminal domain-containing protein [Oscillospiraceae bacterium]